MKLTNEIKNRGLVGALGANGCSAGSTDKWILVVNLVAWRAEEKVLVNEIRCEMPVSKTELNQFMSQVKAYTMVEFQITETRQKSISISNLTVFTGEDPALAKVREELQVPVKISTPILGELVLDRRFKQYNGQIEWCDSKIQIGLWCEEYTKPEAVIKTAESLFKAQKNWDNLAKEFVTDRLLELKNENWLEDNEVELSRTEFLSRITLQEINVEESGEFSFWYHDGDLFLGHSIQVSGDIIEGLKDADIAG